jgi:fructokinase
MIVVGGEALIDMTPSSCGAEHAYVPHFGGSPYNVAIALGRLGVPVAFLGRLSQDFFGQQLRAHLAANGVDISYVRMGAEPSTLAFVSLSGGFEAQYAFWTENSADRNVTLTDLPANFDGSVEAFHFGSFSLMLEPVATTLEVLRDRERTSRVICLDPNVRPALIADAEAYRSRLELWVRMSDIVKVSQQDLAWLCPDDGVETVVDRWLGLGPSLVVVTKGEKGSIGFTRSESVASPTSQVPVVDTVGAGDAFSAAMLAWLHRRERLPRGRLAELGADDLTGLLSFANQVSAITCTRAGSDPPYLAQVLA